MISIHAPTRGATQAVMVRQTCVVYFNPRSHERSDGNAKTSYSIRDNFNPRSHERSDKSLGDRAENIRISIHAPTRGATTPDR